MAMTYHDFVRTFCAAALVSAAMLACSSTSADVAALAGRYELRSVDGRAVPVDALGGALGGDIRLTADGHVTRVVQYATSGIPGPIVNRVTGTYRARGSRITLTLTEQGRTARLGRWEVSGDVSGDVQLPALVLRYAGPAGGIVEERYVRVP
jgi:hypothetical protein